MKPYLDRLKRIDAARDAAILSHFDGSNYAQVAALFNLSESAVRLAVARRIAADARLATPLIGSQPHDESTAMKPAWCAIARQALEGAFRREMEELMYVAVAGSATDHHEALAKAQDSVQQLLAATRWIEQFSAVHSPHKAQP